MLSLAQSTPTWLNGGTVKIALYALVIVAIAVGKIVKAAREQAEIRRKQEQAKRAEIEALRTGRPVEGSPFPQQATRTTLSPQNVNPQMSAAQRLEELAAQRKAKIEELKRARAAAAAGQMSPGPRTVQQSPQGVPQQVARSPVPPPRVPQRAQPKPKPAPKQQRPKQQQQAPRPEPRVSVQPVDTAPMEPTHRLVPDGSGDIPTQLRERRGSTFGGAAMTGGDWRRALILREILSPPVSMRPPGE